MSHWSTARMEMLAALEPTLGSDLIQVFDELLPDHPWRDAIPAEHWFREEVRAAVAAHGPARRHLHEGLVALLGEIHAATLMEYLVPAPWRELIGLGVPVADLLTTSRAA